MAIFVQIEHQVGFCALSLRHAFDLGEAAKQNA